MLLTSGRTAVSTPQLPSQVDPAELANFFIVLFFASAGGIQSLILISGGLTSIIVGPIWWIWLGIQLRQTEQTKTVLAAS